MTRRMLINALDPEECRVAVADDDQLLELEIERADQTQLKGNIYKAPITRIEPSLQAAFLDIGSIRNGFLQINDISPSYFFNWPPDEAPERARPAIQEVLKPGQYLVVQVVKDERSAKGATLTTNLSIPGRYLVLMVGNQRGGVSRKIVDEGQRKRLRYAVQDLRVPCGMGVIVRTAGINKSTTELQRDLDALLDGWVEIVEKSLEPGGPKTLYRESSLAIRTIRDYLTGDIDEILIDEKSSYENACSFVRKIMPGFEKKVAFFEGPQPLFSKYHLDAQVEETCQPEVTLPSGGSIIVSVTEAVVAVDVNSGRSTNQSDVEETAFETNKEAAQAIAKQLRLRDLGGLIVIDFIDMLDRRHKQVVERVLKEAVRTDKAKVEIGRISKFGLLEMSRQRMKSPLVSQSHNVCPHCSGRGRVKTPESAALEALRKIQSAVFAGGVDEIRIHMSPSAALLLLNNKRQTLSQFERQSNTKIIVYADGRMKPEEYELELITAKPDYSMTQVESPAANEAIGRGEPQDKDQRTSQTRSRGDSRKRRSPPRQSRSRQRRSGGGSGNRTRRRRNTKGRSGHRNESRDRRTAGESRKATPEDKNERPAPRDKEGGRQRKSEEGGPAAAKTESSNNDEANPTPSA